MLSQNYLSLKLWRLKPGEEWSHGKTGITFVFLKGGSGRFIAGATAGRLNPGDVLVLDGSARGKIWAPDRAEMVFWWFSICCEHLYPLFTSGEICQVQDVVEEFKRGKLYPGTSSVARLAHRLLSEVSSEFDLEHRSQLLRVLSAILTEELKNMHNHHRGGFVRADEHLKQVFDNLSAAEMLNLSVGELASRFGYSRRHLNRLFHQHFGVSVAALRMEMRLSKAVSLLRDPDAKVIRVAEECGFNHLGLFNTCFKRRFGVSPSQWRRGNVPPKMQSASLLNGMHDCPMHANGLCPWSGKIKLARDAATESAPSIKPAMPRLVIQPPEDPATTVPTCGMSPGWQGQRLPPRTPAP